VCPGSVQSLKRCAGDNAVTGGGISTASLRSPILTHNAATQAARVVRAASSCDRNRSSHFVRLSVASYLRFLSKACAISK
jgi:hypothetical protein